MSLIRNNVNTISSPCIGMARWNGSFPMYFVPIAMSSSPTFPSVSDSRERRCSKDLISSRSFFQTDKQNCTLEIQSWSRPASELLVRHQPHHARQQNLYIRTEWLVYEISVRNATMKTYLWLVFHINMKRNYQFYVNHMIFPFSILSCLTLFVFWLPPDSGEKITLTITILLALTVFLQLISEYTPKASSNLPIIGKTQRANESDQLDVLLQESISMLISFWC